MPTHVACTLLVGVVCVQYKLTEGEMASKKKSKRVRNDYEDDPGISRPKKIPKTLVEKDSEKRLIVVLENASLETIKVSTWCMLSFTFTSLYLNLINLMLHCVFILMAIFRLGGNLSY